MDTFGRVGLLSAKTKFEEFTLGFNQAAERFMMVDVGGAKEAADAKIKGERHTVFVINSHVHLSLAALLEDEIKLPQTEKIIFGGTNDSSWFKLEQKF